MPYTTKNGWFYPDGEDVPFEAVDYDKFVRDLQFLAEIETRELSNGVFSSSDWNGSIVAGVASIRISAGQGLINGQVHRTTATYDITAAEGLTLSTTNYVWRKPDGTFQATTTNVAPVVGSLLLFSGVMSGTEATSINNAPVGRVNISGFPAMAGDVSGTIGANSVDKVKGVDVPSLSGNARKGLILNASNAWTFVSRFGNRCLWVSPADGDYPTLGAALTAISGATPTDQWLIIVSGNTVETAAIAAKSNISVLFTPGSSVDVSLTTATAGFNFTACVNTTWMGYGNSPTLIRSGALAVAGAHVLTINAGDSTCQLVNIGLENRTTGGTNSCFGLNLETGANVEIDRVYAKASTAGANNYGCRIRSCSPTIRNSVFRGGIGSGSAAYGCRVTSTSSNPASPTFYNCEFYGGSGGTSCIGFTSEILCTVFAYNCKMYGGPGSTLSHGVSVSGGVIEFNDCLMHGGDASASCYGFDFSGSTTGTVTRCTAKGGWGGLSCYGGRVENNAAILFSDCTILGGGYGRKVGGTYIYNTSTAKFALDATKPGKIVSAYVSVSVATAGATVQLADDAVGTNLFTDTASLAAATTVVMPIKIDLLTAAAGFIFTNVAGGSPANGSFTITYFWEPSYGAATTSACLGMYCNSLSTVEFHNCNILANIDSYGMWVTSSGILRTKIFGGHIASGPRTTGRRTGIHAAAAWASATIYNAVIGGGTSGPITALAGTANGSNIEV